VTDHLHLVVHGQVQGVGFRYFARQHAQRLGLAGWVKNTGEGTVEILAFGNPDDLALFEKLLARGPSGSQVLLLEHQATAVADDPRPDTFSIIR
jgi:acylphosphatase